MNSRIKTIIGIIIFAVFLGIASFGYNKLSDDHSKESGSSPNSGESKEAPKIMAPDFTVFDASGNKVLLSDFAGKPIVLNFWASWCPPCKKEMPDFNDVYNEFIISENTPVAFLIIDVVDGQRETKDKGMAYIAKQGFDFPVYYDTELQAAAAYGITSIPMTFLIDSKGYIVKAYQGAINKDALISGIDFIIQ